MKIQSNFRIQLLVLASSAILFFAAAAKTVAEERPNILLIVADDVTWSDFGFSGNDEVVTPALDKLAEESLYLTHAFSSSSTCSPTRHSLYSGYYPVRGGAYPNHSRLYEGTSSLFQALQSFGYRTALQGKPHVGPAEAFPFERLSYGKINDLSEIENFITRDKENPWLLVFASNHPHTPWDKGDKNLHPPETIRVPEYQHDNLVTRESIAAYYREIKALDDQVKNLLTLLEKHKHEENTLVAFISEQGNALPYGGKWSLYDTGIRSATLVRWPGVIKGGTRNTSLMQYIDWTPTLINLGRPPDTSPEFKGDGIDFLPVLLGKTDTHRQYIFAQQTTVGIRGYEAPYPMRAARDNRYKYIRNLQPSNRYHIAGIHDSPVLASWKKEAMDNAVLKERIEFLSSRPGEELYDLELDPFEQKNLADNSAYDSIRLRLSDALDDWMRKQNDLGLVTEMRAHERQSMGRWRVNQRLAQQYYEGGDFDSAVKYAGYAAQKSEGMDRTSTEYRQLLDNMDRYKAALAAAKNQ